MLIQNKGPKIVELMLLPLLWLTSAGKAGTTQQPAGEAELEGAFDAAPFGEVLSPPGGSEYVLRWAEPRKIRHVSVEFGPGSALPTPDKMRMQYWHRTWDGRPDPVLEEAGAGAVGWHGIDDWTNGEWKDADTIVQTTGRTWTFSFNPTGNREFKSLDGNGIAYRKTLKVRLISQEKLPPLADFRVLTDAVYRPLPVRILFGRPAEPKIEPVADTIRLEVFNGRVLKAECAGALQAAPGGESQWNLAAAGEAELRAQLLMAVDPSGGPYDRTIVTVRSQTRSFSFAADEVARGERILVDDLGVLVVRGDDAETLSGYRNSRAESLQKTVYERVFAEPEQTLGRAWKDMPLKHPLYFVHGLPGNRNTMRQDPDGSIRIAAGGRWFRDFPSPRDASRKLWEPKDHQLHLGFPGDQFGQTRELQEGYLPILTTRWHKGPVSYEQKAVLDKLDGDLKTVRLDDPTVLLMRVRVVNTSDAGAGTATLFLEARGASPEKLYAQGKRILADFHGLPRLRYLFDNGGRGALVNEPRGVSWSLPLQPGEAHNLYFWIPSVTPASEEEVQSLLTRDFDKDIGRIGQYWRELTARGTQIITPEPWLNNFYRAHVRHLLVNCFKELASDLLHAHVGTFNYGVYPNESVMMISDLDRRGYHDEARRNLDAFLNYQGTAAFLGNYQSKDGLFYGAGGHETGNYNKSHGYVMWAMAEHWRMTADRDWMREAAPKLVRACEWVIRERRATMVALPDGSRPIEYGSLPAGSLEDVTDFWHWLATNSATVWGFESLAGALVEYGHPEATRLQKEARAYHEDVMRGLNKARVLTPVVRLRDGTYVPKYPSHLHQRGRSHGWLRETLEGALFLLFYRLIPPDTPEARWILSDYEDNLYISNRYGYSIPAFDRFWFSRGGFSMQANLLDSPPPYLYRDEIKHYVRAYFNAFASAFYPEISMCNEHSLPELGYPVGDHFKSSDEAQSTYWLRLMFVFENGEDLHLGQAIPRYWMQHGQQVAIEGAASHFGPLSLRMTSEVAQGQIRAFLSPPNRKLPRKIYLRFRHPEQRPIAQVTLNGRNYTDFDQAKEWIILPGDLRGEQEIVVKFQSAR